MASESLSVSEETLRKWITTYPHFVCILDSATGKNALLGESNCFKYFYSEDRV